MRGAALLALLLLSRAGSGRGAAVSVDAAGGAQAAAAPGCAARASDADSLACLLAAPAALDEAAVRATLEACMLRGHWKCAAHLVRTSKAARFDVSDTVSSVSGAVRRELQALTDSLGAKQANDIAPAYECVAARQPAARFCSALADSIPPFSPLCSARRWAQGVEHVYLQVKWAHKLDAPATLGCEPSSPIFSERHVSFHAECREKRKAFALQLPLFGNISADACTWGNASVGRAFVTLRKAADGPWQRLLASTSRPANQHIWWSMRESHADALDAWRSATPTPAATPPPPPAASAAAPTPAAAAEPPEPTQAPLPPLKSLL